MQSAIHICSKRALAHVHDNISTTTEICRHSDGGLQTRIFLHFWTSVLFIARYSIPASTPYLFRGGAGISLLRLAQTCHPSWTILGHTLWSGKLLWSQVLVCFWWTRRRLLVGELRALLQSFFIVHGNAVNASKYKYYVYGKDGPGWLVFFFFVGGPACSMTINSLLIVNASKYKYYVYGKDGPGWLDFFFFVGGPACSMTINSLLIVCCVVNKSSVIKTMFC